MKGQKDFTYQEEQSEYVVQLKRKRYWWLLLFLLLLLPLLLLIRFDKDVMFKTYNEADNSELANVYVKFKYQDRNFIDLKTFKFFTSEEMERSDTSNTEGKVVFEQVSYSLYSKLFFSLEESEVIAIGDCLMGDSLTPRFHGLRHRTEEDVPLGMQSYDLEFQVVDRDDGQPIPDAKVKGKSIVNGKEVNWEEVADANGSVTLKDVPYCSEIYIEGSKYGYKNDSISDKVKNLTGSVDDRSLLLDPLKEMITFTVKDLYSKEPVPNAVAELRMEDDTVKVQTNTNGVGKGAFEDIKVLAQIKIHASHTFYYDTLTPLYKVDEYLKLSDDERIIYIRPKTQTLTFRDIDGKNGKPLPGTRNKIYINSKLVTTQTSNSNGTFAIADVRPDDKISIVASKSGYKTNSYTIKNKTIGDLDKPNSRDIPLSKNPPPPPPPDDNIPRKNCRVHFAGTLLADVPISGHISKIYRPDKYSEYVGAGEYPSNKKAFPKAVKTTFDGIAVDKGTRVIIYSKENFKGKVLLDVTGPAVINNNKWKNDRRIKDFRTRRFKGGLQSNFPPSCRRWSKSNMNSWSNGSVKIICGQ